MKSATTLFALFLLSALTLHLPSATEDSVKDLDGDQLRNGGSFYILSPLLGPDSGGGITIAPTGSETCPLTVIQAPNPWDKGFAVKISSPDNTEYIKEGSPLNLSFSYPPPCASTPSSWTIVEDQPEGWAVKLTGYKNTVQGAFGIESLAGGFLYKLVFCHDTNKRCNDVGIDLDSNRIRLLVVGKENSGPLLVGFQKASFPAAAKIVRYSAAA